MTAPKPAPGTSISGWRIASFSVVMALCAAVTGAVWLHRPDAAAQPIAEPAPPPAFDIGDAANRRVLRMLQGGEHEWLGQRCDPTIADSYRVTNVRMHSHGPNVRTALIVGGNIARVEYSGDPLPGHGSAASSIDADVLAKLQGLIDAAGYPGTLPPGIDSGLCGAEVVTVQSCIRGHYYGVARECPDEKVFPLVEQVLALARDQVGKSP